MKIIALIFICSLASHAQQIVRKYNFQHNTTQVLAQDDNDIFVGTEKGLQHLQGNTWVHYVTAGDNRPLGKITALGQAPDGTLWVGKAGYYGQGIERLTQTNRWFTERLSTQNKKLPGNYVTGLCLNQKDGFLVTIQEDRGGAGGATDLSLDEKSSSNWLSGKTATSCLCTQTSCFVGTENAGLFEFTPKGQQIRNLKIPKPITALAMDTQNRLWIGLKSGGVLHFNRLSKDIHTGPSLKHISEDVRALLVDQANQLWIGTARGLVKMDLLDRSLQVFETIQDVKSLSYESQTKGIWAAAGKSVFGINGAMRELTTADIEALKIIASRQGLSRLDYAETTQQWAVFEGRWITNFKNYFFGKNRFHIIAPLEQLVQSVEHGYWPSVAKDPEVYHLMRRAYSSLSSLYSYYKIDPNKDAVAQAEFMKRFGAVLARFRSVLLDVKNRVPTSKLYKLMPWFGTPGADIVTEERKLGLKYLDMSPANLAEVNQVFQTIGNTHTSVDRAMEFYPTASPSLFSSPWSRAVSKKIVIFNVHGTFAAGSSEYQSDENLLFQQTKLMAQSVANNQNAPVELYSFGWSGANDNTARITAGEELANFVRTYFPSEEYDDIYIGHSHGGNVIFHFAKVVRESRTPFMMVTLATPIRKDFITDNVNYLFQFYAEGDWIQHYGSYELTLRNGTGTGSHVQSERMFLRDDIKKLGFFEHNDRYDQVKIYVAKVLLNGSNPKGAIQSHTDMKYLIGVLPKVISSLFEYPANSAYVLDITRNEKEKLTVTEMERLKYSIKN